MDNSMELEMPPSRSGPLKKVVIWLVLLGVGIGGYQWWKKRRPAESAIEFRTVAAEKGDLIQNVTANGQLKALVTVDVGSQVSGNVRKLHADFNTRVTNGQVLAELDPSTYEARLLQAEADLASAEASQMLAELNAKRAGELVKNKLISESDHDQTMAELKQRNATIKMRNAQLKSATVDLERTTILSPIDGIVISRNVDIGQTVQASFTSPTLFNIAKSLEQMEIAAMVSEADIGTVEEGQEVKFTVDAFPSRTFTGLVSQVRYQPTTNQNVVNYATIISVSNKDLKLKPGMTANVSIITAKKTGVVRVPNAATRFRPPTGVKVSTNVVVAHKSAQAAPAASVAGPGSSEAPGEGGPPGGAGGFQASPEMRQRMLERFDKNGDGQLDDSERQAMRDEFRSRGPGGPGGAGGSSGGGFGMGGGGGGARRSAEPDRSVRTLYTLKTNTAAGGRPEIELQPIQVLAGITDGTHTEILEGLEVGQAIVSGSAAAGGTNSAQQVRNPFGGPFGGPPRR